MMTTPTEYRHQVDACLRLANEANDMYVIAALTELAAEFRAKADQPSPKIARHAMESRRRTR
jgi:hypothetical protein